MRGRKTHETFVKEVEDAVGEDYTVIGQYVTNKIPVLMRHNQCKDGGTFEWEVRPDAFLFKGRRCRKCGGTMKKSNEWFLERIFEIHEGRLIPLEAYRANRFHVRMLCAICSHVWPVKPNHLVDNRSGCPKCANKQQAERLFLTNDEFLSRLKEVHGDEYIALELYDGLKIPIRVLHRACKKEWPVTPGSLLNGQGCFHCFGTPKKSHEEFVREIEEVHGAEYEILTPYESAHEPVVAKHKTCGYEWPVVANPLRKGHGCPNCSKSKGEKEVARTLTKHGIPYKKEHTFEDCVDQARLKFDFAIEKANGGLYLIEYNGDYHYKPIEFFGGEEGFELLKKRDKIKRDYCKDRGIPLLIIPYWDFNKIENIVLEFLDKNRG